MNTAKGFTVKFALIFLTLIQDLECVWPVCNPFQHLCSGTKICISYSLVCNGRHDCGLGDISDELGCGLCTHDHYLCGRSKKCIPGRYVCDGDQDCGPDDLSDELFCNVDAFLRHETTTDVEALQWSSVKLQTIPPTTEETVSCTEGFLCPTNNTCIPKSSICDGVSNCADGSDEMKCDVTKVADLTSEKRQCVQWFLDRRSNSSVNKWGLQVHRTAVALYLADKGFFSPENKTGEEIRYELTIHLLSVLNRREILRTEQLTLYIQAMVVSCLNPHAFHGHDLVSELRKRVNLSKYTNPLAILVLCNADANMTNEDVHRLNSTYFSHHRSYWTEIQVLSTMALSCISSKTYVSVDQQILQQWIDSAKEIPLQNGTATNPRTIALVLQMLLGTNNSEGFNWQVAIKAIQDPSFLSSSNFLDKYYLTPVLSNTGLNAIDNQHCTLLSYNADLFPTMKHQMHTVGYSVWMDKEVDFGRSWRLRMPFSSTLYDVIQRVQRLDSTHTVKYNMVGGKPYVKSVSGVDEDPETDHYWFTYERIHGSAEDPKLLDESPVDIITRENQELILWYRNGIWTSDSYGSGQSP